MSAILFVISCLVMGLLGYRQGRQDEELRWRKTFPQAPGRNKWSGS